uniref:Trichome birefringence-like N-terminal domain-containing protein n=1 Tax=Kalanchoe fedtschenkoi TaxID=63787 RepID=A0A7N0THU2_KALFE
MEERTTPILPTCTTPKLTSAGAMGRHSSADPNADLSPSLRAASFVASRSRRISASGYFFTLAFLACVVVLVSNVSGLSANDMLHTTTSYSTMYRSHFTSVVSRFFPGSSSLSQMPNTAVQNPVAALNNGTDGGLKMVGNETRNNGESSDQTSSGRKERASSGEFEFPPTPPPQLKSDEVDTFKAEKSSGDGGAGGGRRVMSRCDLFDGSWVKDDSYPLYEAGSCPHLDESFDCRGNGRPDREYEKYRWQPKNCNVPRLSGEGMLDLMRGKRFVFVGDSLNRNMWESLICLLRNSVTDKNKVYEVSGREEFRSEGSYSFVFEDYNCSVEFFRSPFLVQEWEMPDGNGKTKETLRLDLVERSSDRYKSADFLVFNTGHWWTHEKTSQGEGYYQEGSHVYDQLDVGKAFRKAMTTWARWVDANINPWRTTVVFRSYSASHFIGGEWNSGGRCESEVEPVKNEKHLSEYPPIPLVHVLEKTLKTMRTPVFYLNITKLSDYRKDAHPSVHQKQNMTKEEKKSVFQDCSHWCLPGVPDTWNELIYAKLLMRRHKGRSSQNRLADTRKYYL